MVRATASMLSLVGVVLAATFGAAGCDENLCGRVHGFDDDGAPLVLAIGDSILAWNHGSCQSIPDRAALAAGVAVKNVAVSGARVLGGDADRPAIPAQVPSGSWRVVIVDGGGNDLNGTCACGHCDDVLNALVSADATSGAVVDLVDGFVKSGAHVILGAYYPLHDGAWYGFDRCGAALDTLHHRYELLAQHDGVELFDFGRFVTPASTPQAYTFDNVHPSDEGSALIGAPLGDRVKALLAR